MIKIDLKRLQKLHPVGYSIKKEKDKNGVRYVLTAFQWDGGWTSTKLKKLQQKIEKWKRIDTN